MLYTRFDEIFGLYGVYRPTIDVASLIDAAGANADFSAPGVLLGKDLILGVIAPFSLQGITVTAHVLSNDNIRIRFQNESGGTVDLASGEYTVIVGRCNRI